MNTEQTLVEELARVTAERDEARDKVKKLEDACNNESQHRKDIRAWWEVAIKERNEARAEVQFLKTQGAGSWVMQVHPEPSRLLIATALKAGWLSNPECDFQKSDDLWWIEQADKLIKASRQ
jgi:hypothetical protein